MLWPMAAAACLTLALVITAFDESEMRAQAEALGCAGFFRKSSPGTDIIDAIRLATQSHTLVLDRRTDSP